MKPTPHYLDDMVTKYAACVDVAQRFRLGMPLKREDDAPLTRSDQARDAVLTILEILDVAGPPRAKVGGRWVEHDDEDEPE